MRKLTKVSLFVVTIISLLVFAMVFSSATLYGDVDKNGSLTASDARFVLRAAVGLEKLTDELLALADVNNDGKVTSADARLVLRASVGLEQLGETGHTHIFESVITEKPTCVKNGVKTVTCKECSYKVTETVEATGHTMGEWKLVLDSTVKEEGYERSTCINCSYYTDRKIPVKTAVFFITVDYGAGNVTKTGVASDGKYKLSTPRREGYLFKGYVDAEGKDFPATGVISGDISVSAVWEIDGTDTFEKLAARANAGAEQILITKDIVVTGPIFVPSETHIYSDGDFSIIRAPEYEGDIFVVGSDKYGNKSVANGLTPVLTLGKGKGTLTVDGNRDNVTVTVNGTLVFVADSAHFNLYDGARLINNNKTANSRVYGYSYLYSETAMRSMGGAAIMNLSSVVNMYGGVIENNAVMIATTEIPKEDGTVSNVEKDSCGGAVYNRGSFTMYGGKISSNEALRGGAIYNDKNCYLVAGEVSDNMAHTHGGAVSSSLVVTSTLYTGSEYGTEKMVIKNNRALRAGGAVYSSTLSAIILYPNTEFIGNHTDTSGGAIYTASALVMKGVKFIGNTCNGNGGAVYHHYASADVNRKQLQVSDCTFDGNTSRQGGAIVLSSSSTAAEKGTEGTYAEITNSIFSNNKAMNTTSSGSNGGAIYISSKSDAIISGCTFSENSAVKNAGAIGIYNGATVQLTDSSFNKNTALSGGAVYLSTDTVVKMNGVDFTENAALMTETGSGGNGGAIYYSLAKLTLKNASFNNNSADNNAGAVYQHASSMTLDNTCSFTGNKAAAHGGAFYLTYSTNADGTKNGSVLNVENTEFKGNSALAGGAISARSVSDLILNKVTFKENSTPDAKMSTTTGGGAIYTNNSTVTITDSAFDGNFSGYYGGAIRFDTCDVILKNTEITNSSGGTGGAVYASGDSLQAENLVLKGNSSRLNGILYVKSREAIFNNLTATENTGTSGGVLYSSGKSAVIIANSELSSNTAKNGGVIYAASASTVELRDNNISGNSVTTGDGGAVFVTEASTVNSINNKFISNNASSGDGGAVYVYGASFNAEGETVFEKNTSSGHGGAIGVFDAQDETTKEKISSVVSISKCSFTENTADRGGALYFNDSQYSVADATLTNNIATSESYGGGALYNTGATGTVDNVVFTGNTAKNGGAVAIYTNSDIEFSNITASDNSATSNGGAFYVNSCKVNLTNENLIFTGNKANNGGAVYAIKPTVFDVSGVVATNNEAANNGGAFYVSGATANISGEDTKISGNKAVNYGGAIYISYFTDAEEQKIGATLNITDTKLDGNTALYGGAISGRTNSTINLTRVVLTENSTPDADLTNKAGGGAIYANDSEINISDCDITKNSSGYYGGAVYTEKTTVSIKDNTLVDENNGGTGAALYLTSSSSLDAKDITVTNNYSKKNGIFYFNGKEFSIENMSASGNSSAAAGGVIYTSGKSNLNVKNSSFTGNSVSGGTGGVLYHAAGEATFENVSFTENTAKTGGVVYTCENSNTVIRGCVFERNTATGSGGAVYQTEGTVNISNTTFTESAAGHGGAIYLTNTDASLADVSFTANTASNNGGAIDIVGADVTVSGTSVFTDNSSAKHGGAVYISYIHASADGLTPEIPGTLTVTGGSFTHNSSTAGGAVSIRSDCEASFDGTVFTENTVSGYEINAEGAGTPDGNAEGGGAIYVGYGKLTLNNVTAENNSAVAYTEEGTNTIIKGFGGAVDGAKADITVTGSSFSGNKASVGGAINTLTSSIVSISNTSFIGNESDYKNSDYDNTIGGGAVTAIGGSLAMDTVIFDGNKSGYYGGALLASGVKVDIINSRFTNSAGSTGAALHFKNSCDVSVFESEIVNNTASNNGVLYANASNVTLEKLTMTGNKSKNGGVIYTSGKSTLVKMNDCEIAKNSASASGGVVYAENSTIIFNGGSVSSNTAKNGGAVYTEKGNISATGTVVSENTASANGGAVYAVGGTVTVTDTTASENSAVTGGAVYCSENTVLTVNTSKFTLNRAKNFGGAVYAAHSVAALSDNSFVSNSTDYHGGAMYICASEMTMTGSNLFDSNSTKYHGGAIYVVYDDVEEEGADGTTTETRVPSSLTMEKGKFNGNSAMGGGAVSIRSACEASFNGTVFTGNTVEGFNDKAADGDSEGGGAIYVGFGVLNLTNVTATDNIASATTTVVEGKDVINPGFGGAVAGMSADIIVTGGTFSGNKASVGGVFNAISATSLTVTGALIENNESDLMDKEYSGNIGGGAIKANGSSIVLDNTTLSGNKSKYYGGAVLATGTTVTVTNGSVITKSEGGTGSALYFKSGCEVAIENSKVTDNTGTNNGAIYANGCTITANGLEATGNKSKNGGVIYVSGKSTTVEANNSTFSNNTATASGGVVYAEKSTVTFIGGAIAENTAKNGGVAYSDAANISFNGTVISENTASESGGAVYADAANISLTDTEISGNASTASGGAIYSSASQITLSGGKASENTAKGGGVVYAVGGVVTVNGTEITENTSTGTAGAVYAELAQVSFSGATVSENTSKNYGGGIYLKQSTAVFTDNTFIGNSSGNHGAAIHIAGSEMTATGNNVFKQNASKNHGGAIYVVYYDLEEEGPDGTTTKTRIPSVLTMENGEFTGNTALGGGAVSIRSACEASFNGTVFTGNTVEGFSDKADGNGEGGGAIYVGYGSLDLTDTVFTGNIANETVNEADSTVNKNYGGAVDSVSSTVTISGGSFDGNKATSGGAINLITNSTLVVNGTSFNANESLGNLTGATDSSVGGGAIRASGGSIILTGVTLDGNKTNYYGAALHAFGSEITIDGNSQILNHSGTHGVALYLRNACDVTIKDVTVKGNKATGNSAIYTQGGTCTVENMTASGNEGKSGSVLYFGDASTTGSVSGSSFSENKASYGAAIYINSATVDISGNTFSKNTANVGGAIYSIKGVVTMIDNVFTENSAVLTDAGKNGNGGAVALAGATLTATGNNTFVKNSAEGHGGATYVSYTTNSDNTRTTSTFTITGGLYENNSASIGGAASVRDGCEAIFNGTVFKNNAASSSDQEGGGGVAYVGAGSVTLSGVEATGNSTGFYGGVLTSVNSSVTVENSSFSGNIAKTGHAFNLRGSTVAEISNTQLIENSATGGNGIIYATGSGSVDVSELTATGNKNTNGGVFYVSGSVNLTIADSVFTNNTASTNAGAIDFRSSGTLSVSDSEFIGNTAKNGGAMNLAGKGAVTIKGCSFENNSATVVGGALNITGSGKVDISDDTVFKGNTAPEAGAVYLDSGAKAEITASSFEGNSATASDGGAISVVDTSEERTAGTTLTLKGVTLDSNTAATAGGAMHVAGSGKAFVSENTVFKGNTAPTAGAVYLDTGATVEISASSFEDNSATASDGGAILIADSSKDGTLATSITLNTVAFNGNEAALKGGAISTDTSSANLVINATTCVFNENKALGAGGGAVEIQNGNCKTVDGPDVNTLVFTNCKFTSNTAKSTGGAVELRSSCCAKFDGIEATGNIAGSSKRNNGGVFYITSNHSRIYLTGTVTQSGNIASSGTFAYLYNDNYSNPPRIYTTHNDSASWVSDVAGRGGLVSMTYNVTDIP